MLLREAKEQEAWRALEAEEMLFAEEISNTKVSDAGVMRGISSAWKQ